MSSPDADAELTAVALIEALLGGIRSRWPLRRKRDVAEIVPKLRALLPDDPDELVRVVLAIAALAAGDLAADLGPEEARHRLGGVRRRLLRS